MSTTSTAIPFLWDKEADPASDQIMVISTVANEELRKAATIHLKSLGFVIETSTEGKIITEPSRLENELVRISLLIDNNVVVISGDKGFEKGNDEIIWEPVVRGKGDGYGSPEWELMNVLANTISHKSILYN